MGIQGTLNAGVQPGLRGFLDWSPLPSSCLFHLLMAVSPHLLCLLATSPSLGMPGEKAKTLEQHFKNYYFYRGKICYMYEKKAQGVQKYIKQRWKFSIPLPRNKLQICAVWYLHFQALVGFLCSSINWGSGIFISSASDSRETNMG